MYIISEKEEKIRQNLEGMKLSLLNMARESCTNDLSSECLFILSEIKNTGLSFFEQRKNMIQENERKTPLPLQEILPNLAHFYDDIHEINLEIYKAGEKLTIIDIRYYLKKSLDPDHRQKLMNEPPMLHSKITLPPWLFGEKKKFDINWQHKPILVSWKMFWSKLKLKRF